MAPRKKTPPPPETIEPGIPAAPAWLRKSCRAAYTNHCRKLRDDGCTLHHVDANHVARLVHTEEDLQVAEAEAAKVPTMLESRANGLVLHPAHKRVSELRSEVRSWLRQLPRPASPSRTSTTSAATSSTPTAATQEPRLELIARIKARLAAMQSTGADGNAAPTTPAAAATPAAS
jgi:hypothetical protein